METITILHEVVAWRAWKVDSNNGQLVLRSLAFDWQWPARQEVRAACRRAEMGWGFPHPGKGIPDVSCSCGFWATKCQSLAQDPLMDQSAMGIVVGKVALWGDIIEHEEGFRAEFAYPRFLEEAVCSRCRSIIPLSKTILRSRTPEERRWTNPADSLYTATCRACLCLDWLRRPIAFRKISIVRGWQDILADRYGFQAPLRLHMT